jgi:hypothetical protein
MLGPKPDKNFENPTKKIAHMKSLILNLKMKNFKNYAKEIMPQKKD